MSRLDDLCQLAERPVPAPPGPAEAALADMLRRANAAWPGLEVEETCFLRHLAACLPRSGALEPVLGRMHAGDLLLALACGQGRPGALRALEPRLAQACRGAADGADPEELLQQLREKLLVGDGARPPRILEYTGRGPLAAWLKVTALRTRLNLSRSTREHALDGDELQALAGPGRDVELDFIQAHYRDSFRKALTESFQALDKRERNLLRLQCVQGLSAEQVGRIYHVSRATMGRWLAQARERLVEGTRSRLAGAVQTRELGGLITLLGSHLDVTLSRLFRTR